MRQFWNQKNVKVFVTGLLLVTLGLGALPVSQAQAAGGNVIVLVDKGWTRFSWASAVRGSMTFTVTFTSDYPALLTFVTSAKVKCASTVETTVGIALADFGRPLSAAPAKVSCAPVAAVKYPKVKGADDYLNDAHYFHGSVPVTTSGPHSIRIETTLATTDPVFWGYVRVDSAPGVAPASGGDVAPIAVTVVDPPTGAWVGVQWVDASGSTWTNVDSWFNPLTQTDQGRMVYWVQPKDYGTGPYRWVVLDKQGGKIWGASDPFYFPTAKSEWVWLKARKISTGK